MNKDQRHLNVTAIENGTVIDHIPANNVFKVLHLSLIHIFLLRMKKTLNLFRNPPKKRTFAFSIKFPHD